MSAALQTWRGCCMLHLPEIPAISASSGRGEIPHRRYAGSAIALASEPASARVVNAFEGLGHGVCRSGAMPEPTVIVRMEEDVQIVMSVPVALPGGLSRAWAFVWNVRRGWRCLSAMP